MTERRAARDLLVLSARAVVLATPVPEGVAASGNSGFRCSGFDVSSVWVLTCGVLKDLRLRAVRRFVSSRSIWLMVASDKWDASRNMQTWI